MIDPFIRSRSSRRRSSGLPSCQHGRSEFKRCWNGQGACRTYCTKYETFMHLCPDASLCCIPYGLKPPAPHKPDHV
ncbi:beta-defensin 124 isoform X1 [Myotis myotis]|uniref:beta-defensin 124 isoform X1 n=1 Tax=Myotis myotis TaxID=51298 RepID=UPI00174825EB|nr:beta-defensin 124 isoform X1 [Myotis myotis]